jgi:RNA polymerase sigma-70 factor, ECF subfamily
MRDLESQWAQWMREANAGDSPSYYRLLKALLPYLRQVVRKGIGAGLANEGEDIVQETLLAIHLKRQTWDETRAILPWIRTILKNKSIDRLRRLRVNDHIHLDAVAGTLCHSTGDGTTPSGEANRILTTLRERQRRILMAAAVEELSVEEIAARENMSRGAVRVNLHRSLKKLARTFGKGTL